MVRRALERKLEEGFGAFATQPGQFSRLRDVASLVLRICTRRVVLLRTRHPLFITKKAIRTPRPLWPPGVAFLCGNSYNTWFCSKGQSVPSRSLAPSEGAGRILGIRPSRSRLRLYGIPRRVLVDPELVAGWPPLFWVFSSLREPAGVVGRDK